LTRVTRVAAYLIVASLDRSIGEAEDELHEAPSRPRHHRTPCLGPPGEQCRISTEARARHRAPPWHRDDGVQGRLLQERERQLRPQAIDQPDWCDRKVPRRRLQLQPARVGNVLRPRRCGDLDSPPLASGRRP